MGVSANRMTHCPLCIRCFADDGHVRDGRQVGRHHDREVEGGLMRGLIPARERAPGVGGLELCGRHGAFRAIRARVLTAIEATQLIVQHAGEAERYLHRPRRQGLTECERHRFGLGVPTDLRSRDGVSRMQQVSGLDVELGRVEHDLGGGLAHLDLDRLLAPKGEIGQVRAQGEPIFQGSDFGG